MIIKQKPTTYFPEGNTVEINFLTEKKPIEVLGAKCLDLTKGLLDTDNKHLNVFATKDEAELFFNEVERYFDLLVSKYPYIIKEKLSRNLPQEFNGMMGVTLTLDYLKS
jgi:hypothetical protein